MGLGQVTPSKVPGTAAASRQLQDVKVVIGNKKMMSEEGVSISQAVDDYMREMEVSSAPGRKHCTQLLNNSPLSLQCLVISKGLENRRQLC